MYLNCYLMKYIKHKKLVLFFLLLNFILLTINSKFYNKEFKIWLINNKND